MNDEQFAALVASIRSRVGQIKKANNSPSPNSWGQIEVACDKLCAEARAFELACMRNAEAEKIEEMDKALAGREAAMCAAGTAT